MKNLLHLQTVKTRLVFAQEVIDCYRQQTSMVSYINSKPVWEKLLDIDSLSDAESENLYFRGVTFANPTSSRLFHCTPSRYDP